VPSPSPSPTACTSDFECNAPHGACVATPDVCSCFEGFSGADCSVGNDSNSGGGLSYLGLLALLAIPFIAAAIVVGFCWDAIGAKCFPRPDPIYAFEEPVPEPRVVVFLRPVGFLPPPPPPTPIAYFVEL